MKGISTILLLVLSNTFMTFAWYGQLKFRDMNWFHNLGLTKSFIKIENFCLNHLIGFVFLIRAVYFINIK